MGTPKHRLPIVHLMLAAVMFAAWAGVARAAAAEQKVALVIGNSAYPSSRLRNPVNDAKAMAERLKLLGFDVILRTDSNLREMTRSFSQFGQKLTPGSVSLFYYAGHGMQVRGKNFLIPIDAEIENEASVTSEAVDVDQLLHQLGPARLSMVILDACRNNPFERRFRAAASGGLAQIDAPTGTLLAYATAPGKVASDGSGSNGLYTEALLKALNMPGLKVEDVFKQVRINVVKASDGQQIPWESSSLTGEFYFVPDNKAAVADEKLKQAEKERAELAKTLEEERRKRDKDTELVRAEMEKLRAELQRARAATAQPASATVQSPVQVAIAPPAASPASPVPAAPATAPAVPVAGAPAAAPKPAQKPPQAATALVQPPPPGTAPSTGSPAPASSGTTAGWAESFALLERFRGQLTYSKAMALLLGIKSDEELELLVTYDAQSKRAPFHSAFALGVNARGALVYSREWGHRSSRFATQSVLENCSKYTAGIACQLVIVNGEFMEKEFMEVVKQLGRQTPERVRQSLVKDTARSLANTRDRI